MKDKIRITYGKLLCWFGHHKWIEISPCRDHNWATHVCWRCGKVTKRFPKQGVFPW